MFSVCSCPIDHECRSRMNVPFRVGSPEGDEALEKKFIDEAAAKGLMSLKGHRSEQPHLHIVFGSKWNDSLNTFYLRLYGVGHMVKNHSDSERGNPLLPHEILFQISSKGSFICIIPQTGLHIPQPLLHQLWSTGWNEI